MTTEEGNKITLANGQKIMLVKIPDDAQNFIVDNSLEFLVFKVPNYKNWVTDDTLSNYVKLQKYLSAVKEDGAFLTTGERLHGKFELLGTYSSTKKEIDFADKISPDWFSSKELGIVNRNIVDWGLDHVKVMVRDYMISILLHHAPSGRFAVLMTKK